MGKKKSIKIDLRVVISLAAVLISLLSLAFLSLEAINLKLKVGSGLIQLSSYSLVEVIFGNADRRIEGSTLLLISFILIIVGSIFNGLYFKCKYSAFVGGICNLFASMYCLSLPSCSLCFLRHARGQHPMTCRMFPHPALHHQPQSLKV